MEPSKKDWKLFRDKINVWQESYMERLVKEYALLLNGNLPASSKFWELEKRIKLDKNKPGVILSLKKQQMLLGYGVNIYTYKQLRRRKLFCSTSDNLDATGLSGSLGSD